MRGTYNMGTGYRKGFKTREAAENFHIERSLTPAYCPLHSAVRGTIEVTDPITRAHGRVHVITYTGTSKAGKRRTYYASYIGA